MLVFGKELSLGVDVELIRDFSDMDAVAQHTFSRQEYLTFSNLPASQRPIGFFNCWTRKEAYVKALGAGLGYPLNSFDVTLEPEIPAQVMCSRGADASGKYWELYSFEAAPNHVACIAMTT